MHLKFLNRTGGVIILRSETKSEVDYRDNDGDSYGHTELLATFNCDDKYVVVTAPQADGSVLGCSVPSSADKIYVKFGIADGQGVRLDGKTVHVGDKEERHVSGRTYIIGLASPDANPVILESIEGDTDGYGALTKVDTVEGKSRNWLDAVPWVICLALIFLLSVILLGIVAYCMWEKNITNPFLFDELTH